MTNQVLEGIREGIARIIDVGDIGLDIADQILSFLANEGLMVEVEGKLPKNPYNSPEVNFNEDTDYSCWAIYEQSQQDILKAGYKKVNPLSKLLEVKK